MVSASLLDINVLLALGSMNHVHYEAAKAWFKRKHRGDWATCPFTECGFLRISANKRLTAGAGNLESALAVLQTLRKEPGHVFMPDDYSPLDQPLFAKLQGHDQVTDAYLLGLCVKRKAKLATFDAALKTMAADLLGDASRVLLIPTSAS